MSESHAIVWPNSLPDGIYNVGDTMEELLEGIRGGFCKLKVTKGVARNIDGTTAWEFREWKYWHPVSKPNSFKVGDTIMVQATVISCNPEDSFPLELDVHGNHVILNQADMEQYNEQLAKADQG